MVGGRTTALRRPAAACAALDNNAYQQWGLKKGRYHAAGPDVDGTITADQAGYLTDLDVKLSLLKAKLPVEQVADLSASPKVLAKLGPCEPGKTT